MVIPIMGLCYVGTAIMGTWMLGAPVNAPRCFGIVLIIAGTIVVARSLTEATFPSATVVWRMPGLRDSGHKP